MCSRIVLCYNRLVCASRQNRNTHENHKQTSCKQLFIHLLSSSFPYPGSAVNIFSLQHTAFYHGMQLLPVMPCFPGRFRLLFPVHKGQRPENEWKSLCTKNKRKAHPFGCALLCLVNTIDTSTERSATTFRSPFTVLRTAPVDRGIFPRPKNVPPARFLNGLSNPPFFIKKEIPSEWMGFLFWRSSRDLNPGDTFMPYEISSHASSTT